MADALVDRGNEIKEEMFGPEHGKAKLDRATDFTRAFEELVCKYCFAEVWGRDDQLPRNIRSMLTIAMLVALGKPHGVRVHGRAAIANGVSSAELGEVAIQAAVSCGTLAAADGFGTGTEVLDELQAA